MKNRSYAAFAAVFLCVTAFAQIPPTKMPDPPAKELLQLQAAVKSQQTYITALQKEVARLTEENAKLKEANAKLTDQNAKLKPAVAP